MKLVRFPLNKRNEIEKIVYDVWEGSPKQASILRRKLRALAKLAFYTGMVEAHESESAINWDDSMSGLKFEKKFGFKP